MKKLPKEGRSQEVGRLAGRALGTKLPHAWIEKELDGDTDFGLDYLIQLKSGSSEVSNSFYLQLKGTTSPNYSSSKDYITYDFKVETLRYYQRLEPLVMVAVVDLKGHENELWQCPIYYKWLDEEWFEKHEGKLLQNKTISVALSAQDLITPSLDIYNFYNERISKKFALNKLDKAIANHSDDPLKSIDLIGKRIVDKPILLKSIEEESDLPWIHTPEGSIANELKQSHEGLTSNRLSISKAKIEGLLERTDISNHEMAEIYYQQAKIYSLEGMDEKATHSYEQAYQTDKKTRYKIAYFESLVRAVIDSGKAMPKFEHELSATNYEECIVKAKYLALTGHGTKAYELLKTNHPDNVSGHMLILSIIKDEEQLHKLIQDNEKTDFQNDREAFIYYAVSARSIFNKASENEYLRGQVVPVQGRRNYDLALMKKAFVFIEKAWDLACKLGYPSDVTILFDVGVLVYGYFNRTDELLVHFRSIIKERPYHPELIRYLSRLEFNDGKYSEVVDLITRLDELNPEDASLLILSKFNLKKTSDVLSLVQKHEEVLLKNTDVQTLTIFCVAAEIAKKQLNPKLSEHFLNTVKGFDEGEALLAIHNFVTKANENSENTPKFAQELYDTYKKLGRPLVIAEQLFRFLDSGKYESALQIIELSNQIIDVRELLQEDYLHLANAFIEVKDWQNAEQIAVTNINKKIDVANWYVIKAAALHHQGRYGESCDALKEAISNGDISIQNKNFFIQISFMFNLYDQVEEMVKELLSSEYDREKKIYYLNILISIYSADSSYKEQLSSAVDLLGETVDPQNLNEEGMYLQYFLILPVSENDESKVDDFRKRLAAYTKEFPDSPVLRSVSIDTESGAEGLLASLNKITGVSDEQVTQWKKNKNDIRSGKLPVPFCVRELFLRDTNDIYSTWALSLHMPSDELEYKIKHAPQLDNNDFKSNVQSNNKVFIEETSLLALNELGLLDDLLKILPSFYLLDSVFHKLARSSHPISGSIYTQIPKSIINSIQNYRVKLVVLDDSEDSLLESYLEFIKQGDYFLITEDLYLTNFLSLAAKRNISSGNIFNVIEFLNHKTVLSDVEKFTLISKACTLGLFEPNMKLTLLYSICKHFLNVIGGIDYRDTEFKSIFDKLFDKNRSIVFSVKLFFQIVDPALIGFQLESKTLLSLIQGFLLRFNYKSMESFLAFWFLVMLTRTELKIKNELSPVSGEHLVLWDIFREMLFTIKNREVCFHDIISLVLQELFKLDEHIQNDVYHKVLACFVPMSSDFNDFKKMYEEKLISKRLEGTLI